MDYGYHFFGMHMIWWIIWIGLLVWIFMTPYPVPGEKQKKDAPIQILKERLAKGEIETEEYDYLKEKLLIDQD